MDLFTVLGYAGAVLTGLVLGLLGGGGALFSIPVLVYLFHLPASSATGYSLFLVGITASAGAIQNIRKQLVDFRSVIYYGVPSVIAVYIMRRFILPNLPDTLFTTFYFTITKDHLILLLLSFMMILAGIKMASPESESTNSDATKVNFIQLGLFAIAVGSFLGLVGAGGGFLMVPALVLFAGLPIKRALSTSLVLVAVNSFIGFLGDVTANIQLDWNFLLLFSAFSVSGVFIGTYLQKQIDGKKLRVRFGWMMMIMGIAILLKEFSEIL